MAENIVSPGVFTRENDLSFIPQGVAEIGAAIVGPTVKGPVNVPIKVNSFSDYAATFGTTFKSGSQYYEFFTSIAAEYYLRNSGALTVVRVASGSAAPASASVYSNTTVGLTFASASVTIDAFGDNQEFHIVDGTTTYRFIARAVLPPDAPSGNLWFFQSQSLGQSAQNLKNEINNAIPNVVSASIAGPALILSGSAAGTRYNGIFFATSSLNGAGPYFTQSTLEGGTDSTTQTKVFDVYTLADGVIMNNSGALGTNDALALGTADNVRWEISNVNNETGTFTFSIRRGDDTQNRKIYLEQYNNVNLDPNTTNYIGRAVGTQYLTIQDAATADPFLQLTGDYPNISKYIRVANIVDTVDYLDTNGDVRVAAASASLPSAGSGSEGGAFGGGLGGDVSAVEFKMFDNITETNVQGLDPDTDYTTAFRLLKNQDEYDINLLIAPGMTLTNHGTAVAEAKTVVEDRGDVFLVVDPVLHGTTTLATVTSAANSLISSYAATYWPWVKIRATRLNRDVWVPPSVVMPGVLSYNDSVSAEWFAPAGLTRGGIDIAVQAERKLTKANRDTLYDGRVNPIATFPGQGVTVFGQKTLQKKATSLDRVNVRRLLINLKKFIASTSRFLIFENNTSATRNRFLNTVVPYMESVQQNQGLYAFRVIMDETNNTPDIIDRNILKGDIYIQPARAAEFIVIDFNILPTGAQFGE